jgi:hypothetical protein
MKAEVEKILSINAETLAATHQKQSSSGADESWLPDHNRQQQKVCYSNNHFG